MDGGCGHYKNAVMLNIRVNNIAELDVMAGTCKLNFFLDCAFWVRGTEREKERKYFSTISLCMRVLCLRIAVNKIFFSTVDVDFLACPKLNMYFI
jgi:hypothetical protein